MGDVPGDAAGRERSSRRGWSCPSRSSRRCGTLYPCWRRRRRRQWTDLRGRRDCDNSASNNASSGHGTGLSHQRTAAGKPSMTITTRPATAADLPALAALFREMEAHYDGPAAAPGRGAEIVAALQRHAFAPEATRRPAGRRGRRPAAGLRLRLHAVSAARCTPALFLKDIFVSAGDRSRGVGRALMRAVAPGGEPRLQPDQLEHRPRRCRRPRLLCEAWRPSLGQRDQSARRRPGPGAAGGRVAAGPTLPPDRYPASAPAPPPRSCGRSAPSPR